jgi:LysR family transcriptional regulator, glycine cleavage system transcriptional activator
MRKGMSERAFELPPLELLVAFESAARHLSFTRAGAEIALTQSAVSRQVLALEERLGVPLFRRLHRALALTEDGATLYAATLEALGRLDRATRAIRHSERPQTVVVTTTPGFAGLWLIPRLAGFVADHPGVDVRISASNALVNLERDGVDIGIRYRPVRTAGPDDGVRLFGETVSPVCSPRLLRPPHPPLARPADLAAHTLLRMEPDGGNQLQDWGLWLQAMKLSDLRPAGVLHFSSYDQLISAAIAGQGIALGRVPLIDGHLKSRALVAPFSDSVVSPRCYFMVASQTAAEKPAVRAFMAWLAESARAPGSGRRRDRARS